MKSIDQVQPRLQHIFRNAGGARVAVALGEAPDGVHLGFHVVLVAGHDVAEQLIGLRDPYVEPLHLMQIALLKKKRALKTGDEAIKLIDQALGTTLNGVAQGLRNTG